MRLYLFLSLGLIMGGLDFLQGQTKQGTNHPPEAKLLAAEGDRLLSSETRNDAARRQYHKALGLDASNPSLYYQLADSFLKDYSKETGADRDLDSALHYANRARTLDPAFVEAYVTEAESYRRKWRHGKNRKVLLEALSHHPDHPEILTLLGRNYFDTGNPGLALPYLEKAIQLGGNNVPEMAYRYAGWCWFYLEDHHKQLAYFSHFRELEPQNLMGIAGQIHSYTGMKDYKMATALAKQIKADNPDYPNPAYLEAYIAEALLFARHFEEAIIHYQAALKLDPEVQNLFATRAATTTLGYLLMQSGKEKEGKALVQKTIDRRTQEWKEMPERWEFSFDLASAYAAKGDYGRAFQWLATSVQTGYPGHLWKDDPIFSACHEQQGFQELVRQARKRVEGELLLPPTPPTMKNLRPENP